MGILDLNSNSQTQNRIIAKNGHVNIERTHVGRNFKRYFFDIFTTLVDAKWRYMFCAFIVNYLVSWTFFACLWYLMAVLHGDIKYYENYFAAEDKEAYENELDHTPCVRNLYNFVSALLYSIETQNAVGYGFRHVTEECAGTFVLILQILASMLIQALTIGVIIAKLARPKKRAQNVIFSKNAVVCHRDGAPYLMFRVGDTQKSYIVQSHVRARVINKRVTKEGELVEFHQVDLTLQIDNCDNRIMMLWPTLVLHKIDESSPFYNLSAQQLQREQFEIVVLLEGGVESTGLQTQARSSYIPTEILWGHRFQSIVTFKEGLNCNNEVDYELFHNTYPVDIPLCSAKDLEENVENEQQTIVAPKRVEFEDNVAFRNLYNGDSNFVK